MSCKTILPTNIDKIINILDEVGCRDIEALQERLNNLCNMHNPLKVDEKFLGLLADEYGAYFFKEFESKKREVISYAQQHYKKLGTISAVKDVFKALNIEVRVKEWFETGKDPYIFDLDLSLVDRQITPDLIKTLKKMIGLVKNARSKLDELILSYTAKKQFGIGVGVVCEISATAKMGVIR